MLLDLLNSYKSYNTVSLCCTKTVKSVVSSASRHAFKTPKRLVFDSDAHSMCAEDAPAPRCASRAAPTAAVRARHSSILAENARIYSSPLRTARHRSSTAVMSLATSRQCTGAQSVMNSATTKMDKDAVRRNQADKWHLKADTSLKDRQSNCTAVSVRNNSEQQPRCNWRSVTSARQHETLATDLKPATSVELKTKKKRKRTKPDGSVLTMIIVSFT